MKIITPLRLSFCAIGIGAVGLLWGSAALVWLLLPGGSPQFMPANTLLPAVLFSLVIFGGLGFMAAVMTENWESDAH